MVRTADDDAVPSLGYWSESELQKNIRCPFCDRGTEHRLGPIVVDDGKPAEVAELPLEPRASDVASPFTTSSGPPSCKVDVLLTLSCKEESHMVEASSESESTGTGTFAGLLELQQPCCPLWEND